MIGGWDFFLLTARVASHDVGTLEGVG